MKIDLFRTGLAALALAALPASAALKPAGGNKLTAAGFKAAKGAKLVVALIDKSGAKIFATFQTK